MNDHLASGRVNYILSVMNNFDVNIQFSYETKTECKLPFLDLLFHRKGNKETNSAYRNWSNNGMYLNWDSFTSVSCKGGTLKTYVELAYLVCVTDQNLKKPNNHRCVIILIYWSLANVKKCVVSEVFSNP